MEEQTYKLKKLLKDLSSRRGRHTELISIYIPKGYPLHEIMNLIANEISLTQNVKSKAVRKNVISALTKIQQHLKLYKHTPEHGIAVFCGNISKNEGVADVKLWSIEPPEPVKVKLYWCDQKFELKPLEGMIEEKDVYGLLVLDNKEATVGLLKGKSIKVVRRMDSLVPGKFRKGGQSASRFARVREGLINDFYKTIAETAKKAIPKTVKGILLGGPGPAKDDFYKNEYLPTDMKNKIVGIKNLSYTDESGLNELVNRSQEELAEASISKEKELVKNFFEHLQKGDGKVTYGVISVKQAMEKGAVDMILINEGVEWEEVELTCNCGYSEKKLVRIDKKKSQKCPKCGNIMGVIGEMDLIDAFRELAKQYGTEVEIISTETPEGERLKALGGIAAMLRYRL